MSSVDHWIAQLGHGGGLAIALLVAVLLGLRHATDPDHLTAVSTLALSDEHRGGRRAGILGLSWGVGHATTLILFGLPALLLRGFLPEAVQRAAEALIGLVIVALAARLLYRWRRRHVRPTEEHSRERGLGRSPLGAYGIGLIHGLGGSAAVTILLVDAIPQRSGATVALVLFALATALSMCGLSAGFGSVIARRAVAARLDSAVPLLGLLSLAFGVLYGAAAL